MKAEEPVSTTTTTVKIGAKNPKCAVSEVSRGKTKIR